MIDLILEMMSIDKHYGKSVNIDIAKGKYKKPSTMSEGLEQLKRANAWR